MVTCCRAFALCILSATLSGASAQVPTITGHPVRMDETGKILSWYFPQSRAFHFVASMPWTYLASTPVQPNGLPTFYTYPTFDPTTGAPGPNPFHNPAGLNAMLADGAVTHYAYSGDRAVVELVKGLLDHQLAFGSTPSGWVWPLVPYASSNRGDVQYRGGDDTGPHGNGPGAGDGLFVIETDKVGELGLGYLKFWQLTGEKRYLDGALACADALASNVRAGDETHSPWPFRVHAETGVAVEQYTANAVGPVKLFDSLVRLGLGQSDSYRAARDLAWRWVLEQPLRTGYWTAYFEDVPAAADLTFNLNQYIPMETARFMMLHPEYDSDWRLHVPRLLDFVERTFAQPQFGANTIAEQVVALSPMGSHTARYASVLALWSEKSGDAAAREKAFRSLNWATYMCNDQGVVDVGDNFDHWFSDGYGDYTRHFLAAIGSVPEWAPSGESHLLRSSTVVQRISYSAEAISYATSEPDSTEVFRLAAAPAGVIADGCLLPGRSDLEGDGYTTESLAGGDVVVRVRHARARTMIVSMIPPLGAQACRVDGGGCHSTAGGIAWPLLACALWIWISRRRARASGLSVSG